MIIVSPVLQPAINMGVTCFGVNLRGVGVRFAFPEFFGCIYNLLYLGLGYRLAAFVALKFMNKEKQRAA
eukprot:6228952-Pyramimonas_sp.AAC.1